MVKDSIFIFLPNLILSMYFIGGEAIVNKY